MDMRLARILAACSIGLTACAQTPTPSGGSDAEKVMSIAEDIEAKGDDATALAIYGRALELAPNDEALLAKVGDLHLRNRRFDSAAAAYRKAIANNPSNADALIGLGSAQIAAGDLAEGRVSLARATSVAKTHSSFNRLGVAQTQAGQFVEAGASYMKALALRKDADTVANLALTMSLAGQSEEAIDLMRKVAGTPEASIRQKANFALVLAIAGREEEAKKVLPASFPEVDARSLVTSARKIRATNSPQERGRVLSVLAAG